MIFRNTEKYVFYYHAYGLHFCANVEIPGLSAEQTSPQSPDIAINMGAFPKFIQELVDHPISSYFIEPDDDPNVPAHLSVSRLESDHFHFNYGYGVEFVIDSKATTIWGKWQNNLTLETAALYLLGPIIGFMLRLRNITCLHASGIVVNNVAFALTGASGAGKSTLAASFASAGFPILTDDILPLTQSAENIHAHPGYSRLRLYPNSFKNQPDLPDDLPLLSPDWDKCYLAPSSGPCTFQKVSSPLKVIYIINWSHDKQTTPTIEAVAKTEIIPLLAANTYRNELLTPAMRIKEFKFLGQLITNVKVKKLTPVDDISAIATMRQILLNDFRQEMAVNK